MKASPFALRLGLLALLGWSLSASAETFAAATVSTDSASGILSRAVPLVRRSVRVGDHRMTVVRIRAPRLPKLPPALQTPPSADDLATEARRAMKTEAYASFSLLLYPGPITEITWQYGERTYRAYSSIDFRYMEGLSEIETDTAIFSWFGLPPLEQGEDGLAPELRKRLGLRPTYVEYVVDSTKTEMEAVPEAFAVLDAIHTYYEANRRQLAVAYGQRQAERDAREAYRLAHPPVVPDTTVYLWKPEN